MRLLALLLPALLPQTLAAGHPPDDGSICDTAALHAAAAHSVPPQVMLAITRVETGRRQEGALQPWPWAVNLDGQSHFLPDRDQAIDLVNRALSRGDAPQIDIGCFQINLRWHGAAFSSVAAMFDPAANAAHAAGFLVSLHDETGNWVDAVAAYHSRDPTRAAAYVARVETAILALDLARPLGAPPEPRPNRFPLLQPGTGGSTASLVPLGEGARRPLIEEP